MHALQELGEKLLLLNRNQLVQLKLPEALFEAIKEGQRITANGATARHKQYIGRLMREIDVSPISDQLARWSGESQEDNAHFHRLENLRTRLLQDDGELSDFLVAHPQADSQQLRTLIRNARKEAAADKPPKSSRELFRLLREICGY